MAEGNKKKEKSSGSGSGAGRKRTGRQNTAPAAGNSRYTERSPYWDDEPLDEEPLQDIKLIVLIAVCILLFICNIGNFTGAFGYALRSVMFGAFGVFAYVFPVVLFGFIFLRMAKSRLGSLNIPLRNEIAFGVLCIVFMVASEFISGHPAEFETFSIPEICGRSSQNKAGGGLIGGSLAFLLNYFLSRAGSILLLIVIAFICLVILSNKAILRLAADNSRKAARAAGKHINRAYSAGVEREQARREHRREMEAERQRLEEEQDTERILRMDRVAYGIGDTTIVDFNNDGVVDEKDVEQAVEEKEEEHRPYSENMHRITLEDEPEDMEIRVNNGSGSSVPLDEETDVYVRSDEMHEISLPGGFSNTRDEEEDRVRESEPEPLEEELPRPRPVRKNTERPRETGNAGTPAHKAAPKPVAKDSAPQTGGYVFPSLDLLKSAEKKGSESRSSIEETARNLERTLETFGVKAQVTDMSRGPAVTRYELHLAEGVKVNSVTKLSDDLKLALAATDVRIEAPIPGKSAVGIEVPNKVNTAVPLKEIIGAKEFTDAASKISFAVGKDIAGKPVVTDLAKMPHLLIAGATGSGKSVCINTIIMSILYKARPDEVKLMMIDPKVVELSVYNGIPHLVAPVVTDAKKAAGALNWAVSEMNDRYKKFADAEVRNIAGYNALAESEKNLPENERIHVFMPHMVIIVDELADLMMVARSDVENAICRLAQLARAAGMHLILATQRPSVDVITGLIKANMPSRIAFAVTSFVDSKTILDMGGAEKLLGKGDMLFYPQGMSRPARVQGAFVSDKEVSDVTSFIKDQVGRTEYDEDIQKAFDKGAPKSGGGTRDAGEGGGESDLDEFFADAGRLLIEKKKASIGLMQRAFRIGFNRAARLMDELEENGVVGADDGSSKGREILMTMEEFDALLESLGV
ncbi:MAG: DNA translocase FtsK [Lachnospiraceae bacterium]|nr:DNA translocase FtsK [Lachnospiraceae bacterium]